MKTFATCRLIISCHTAKAETSRCRTMR
jgi:hypothetical protein